MAIDRTDFDIIGVLQNNARLTNKELAAKVGLAPSSCLERVRALTRGGVLKGHHAEVTASAVGITLEALVAVRLVRHSTEVFRRLYAYMLSLPEVLTVYHVSGVNDLQVHVAVRDIGHLRDLIVERLSLRNEVEHCETAIIFEVYRKHQLPCYTEAGAPTNRGGKRRKRDP